MHVRMQLLFRFQFIGRYHVRHKTLQILKQNMKQLW